MNWYLVGVALLAFVLLPAASVGAQEHGITPEQMKWMPAPPAFPKGAQIAVLAGDPSKEGQYVFRLKAPAGYNRRCPIRILRTRMGRSFRVRSSLAWARLWRKRTPKR